MTAEKLVADATAGTRAAPAPADPDPLAYEIVQVRDHAQAIADLRTKGFSVPARSGVPPGPFRLPFDWHADPLRDRNWMFQLHAWRMLDPHLHRLLAEPGHPRAFADILEVIADWHRGNVRGRPGPLHLVRHVDRPARAEARPPRPRRRSAGATPSTIRP